MRLLKSRAEPDWTSALVAGFAAGTAMIAFQTVAAPMTAEPAALSIQRAAAILIGPGALFYESFGMIVAFGIALHLVLSLTFAILFEPVLRRAEPGPAILAASVYGAALYLIDYHGASYFFPWFAAARGGTALSAHMTFGAVLGLVFVRLRRGLELEEA